VTERRWVVNASPLIFLAHIDALPLLKRLTDEVVVPFSVHQEVLAGAGQGSGMTAFELPDWLILREDLPLLPEIAGWDLGAGESQVLAHTVFSSREAVMDDLQGRHCARALGVPTTGTLGVILRAKKAGLVPAARPLVEELLKKGLYLSRNLWSRPLARSESRRVMAFSMKRA
jgi:predicted nucleic acid-binding protein